jgi:hypothetical protein
MDKEASTALGEPVLESVILLARGFTKKTRSRSTGLGGVLGSVLSRVAADKLTKDTTPEQLPPNGYLGGGFLVLTASKLVLFATDEGRFKQTLGEQLAQFYPGQVDRIEFGKAGAGVGTIDLVSSDGNRWAFEYSKVMHKKLLRMAEASQAIVTE